MFASAAHGRSGAWDSGRDHIRVADRLDLLDPVTVGELVEVREETVGRPTISAGCRPLLSGVKSTTSAKRMLAASNWSAIAWRSLCSRSTILSGRMLRRSCSTRC
jgi:hypothetical protein